MRRALIVCPGRGSYDRAALGQLVDRSEAARAVVERCDAFRAAAGRPTISELDAAEAYRTTLHVAGENASLLTFACGLADLADLDRTAYEVVGVTGNSMGFYTALAASGALSLDDAIALVETMGQYQAGNVIGGQILYPMTDADWRTDPARRAVVEKALQDVRDAGHVAEWSIELGGFAVLGADRAGVKALMEALPPDVRGDRTFPVQLPLHSAFHTSLMAGTSEAAFRDVGGLGFRAPDVPLVDGRGWVFRPRWADPTGLRDYTLGHQVVAMFDFTTAVHTALEHTAPDVVIALGPGNALGGPLARILVEFGWQGVQSRADFDALQASDAPALLSFGVTQQRKQLV
ncbi:MAG: ACP S-malonyltransferase [Alphaproteobacteria bacterium]|nr:ACP S-malonyltransferase [Alphaproteobacteria bacterium]